MSARSRLGCEIIEKVSEKLDIDSKLIKIEWHESVPHVRIPTRLRYLNEERMKSVLEIVSAVMCSEVAVTHDMTNQEYQDNIAAVLRRLRGG